MNLKGKNAIVTGCGRGIGFEIAKKFLEDGCKVFGCDLDKARVVNAKEKLHGIGDIEMVNCDISSPESVEHFIKAAVEYFGERRIDILANNAGIAPFSMFEDITIDTWRRTLDVNLTGTFNMCKAVTPIMKENHYGVIVNMASTNGILGEEGLIHYNASKAGIILLTKTLAIELGKYGIRSVSICPGFILTELQKEGGVPEEVIKNYIKKIPAGRVGTPRDVANAFAFAASDEASFITGSEIVVDGGQICQE
jgi:3-oxoacyl-[acyl-carrier protein] reductase